MRTFFILVRDDLQNFFRSKRAVIFLVLYLAVFGLITYVFFQVQAQMEEQVKMQGISNMQRMFIYEFGREFLRSTTNSNPVITFLLTVPPLNIVLFFVSLIGTPILLFILNYDRISQEIYDGTIRYVLFRASRFQVFLAKFCSSVIECGGITLVALFLGVLWGSMMFPASVDFGLSMTKGLRYWLIAQFFLAAFSAISLMASAFFKKPFVSLIFCFVSYILMPVLTFWIPYVSLYDKAYFEGLFFHTSPTLFFSLTMYGVFTALFLTVGFQIFSRKDL